MIVIVMMWFTVVFIFLCLTSIAVSYFWAKKQKMIYPKTLKKINNHTFLFQSIVDENRGSLGLEALLRKFDSEHQKWVFPDDIDTFTLREVIILLQKSFVKANHPSEFLALNINLRQLADPRYEYFIRWVKGECYPMGLRIEFNVEQTEKIGLIQRRRIKKNLKVSSALDVRVILEKVEPTYKYYQKIKWVLNDIYGIKIPLSKFQKKNETEWLDMNIGDWVRLIRERNKSIDFTEIEEREDFELANKLNIDNRQGYFIDKPHFEE